MNTWLRARVALQGVTIVALVAGSLQLKKAREAEKELAVASAAAEAEMQKQEFVKRLKEAERVTVEEADLARAMVKRKSDERRQGKRVIGGSGREERVVRKMHKA